MSGVIRISLLAISVLSFSACGKILASIGKGVAHEADNAASAASKAAAPEEAYIGSYAAGSVDDAAHGPKAGDEISSETPISDFAIRAAKKAGEEIGESAAQEGLEAIISDDDNER